MTLSVNLRTALPPITGNTSFAKLLFMTAFPSALLTSLLTHSLNRSLTVNSLRLPFFGNGRLYHFLGFNLCRLFSKTRVYPIGHLLPCPVTLFAYLRQGHSRPHAALMPAGRMLIVPALVSCTSPNKPTLSASVSPCQSTGAHSNSLTVHWLPFPFLGYRVIFQSPLFIKRCACLPFLKKVSYRVNSRQGLLGF